MHQQILQEPGKERVGSEKDQVTGFLAPEEPAFQVSQQTHNPGRGQLSKEMEKNSASSKNGQQ